MLETILYIFLAIIGFFVAIQIYIFLNSYFKKGKNVESFGGELSQKIQAGKKLLLYFYTPACGACKAMTPVIESMRSENKDVHKINLAKDMQLAKVFGVMGTPATIVIEDVKIKKYILGTRSENFLRRLMDN